MRYRFGPFLLDAGRFELTRAGERLEVRRKVFDVLRYLVEHPERLVTKQELLDALWSGLTVEEASVPWTISHARRVLGQRARAKSPIETVHGRGYRWCAPLEIEADEAELEVSAYVPRPFVGRDSLIAVLRERLVEVHSGRGGACVFVGDAGIGKTRCIDEVSAIARTQGFAIAVGRCAQDKLAPVYAPWIQLLRSVSVCAAPEQHRELVALLSQLAAVEGDGWGPEGRDAGFGRIALFQEVGRLLGALGGRQPLLLVLEDLHWGDEGTLELLAYVAADLRVARVLLLAASRLDTITTSAASAELLRSLERFDLAPLELEHVVAYMHAHTDGAAPVALCEAMHRASAGYPLFLEETLRELLAQHGRERLATLSIAAVQPSAQARFQLRARAAQFSAETVHVLSCASVLGEHFDVGSVQRLTTLPQDALLSALDRAAESGFIHPDGVNRFRFRHALFRDELYERMSSADRARWHRAAALLRAVAPDAAERTSEVAHHHHRSLALGHYAEVRVAAIAAAQVASRALAFADAAQFFAFALEALVLDPDASQREYAELLLQRARAQSHAGSTPAARETIEQLVKVASANGFGDLLVQAARPLRLSHAMGGVPDALARTALERALELLPESSVELRLQALSLLSWLAPCAHDLGRSKALSATVLERARGSGSRDALAEALTARLHALSGPDDIDALIGVTDEMLALDAEPRGWISIESYTARSNALVMRGDLAAADAAYAAMREIVNRRGFLEARWYCDRNLAQRRLLAGDFAGAARELARLEDEAVRLRVWAGRGLIAMNRALLSIATSGPAAQEPADDSLQFSRLLRSKREMHPSYRGPLARTALWRGHRDLARSLLKQLAADDFAGVPKDLCYLHTLCNLALVAVELDERCLAERAFELLEPYAAYNTPNLIGLYEGPVAYFLARLSMYLERSQDAERFFAQALDLDEQLGLQPLLAVCCFEYARWSFAAGRTARAAEMRTRAIELADSLQLVWLADQARALAA